MKILERPFYRGLTQAIQISELDRIAEAVNYHPHDGQREIHQNRARFRVPICGRRFGKSFACGFEGLATSLLGGWVWCLAPTYDQAGITMEEMLRMAINSKLYPLVAGYSSAPGRMHLSWKSGGRAIQKSSDRAEGLVGRGLDLVIFDEGAEESDPTVWQQRLRPALADREGGLLLPTTPGGDDWVKDLFDRGGDPEHPEWWSIRRPTATNPIIDPREIEAARKELPDAIFRQQFLAEFLDSIGAVFRGFREIALHPMHSVDRGEFVMGVDIGRYQDFTVVTVMDSHTNRVVYMDRWNQISWELCADRVAEIAHKYHAWVLIDSTGVGDPVLEMIDARSPLGAEGYTFTMTSKAHAINQLSIAIEQKEIELLHENEEMGRLAIGELSAYRYERTEAGNLRMGAPVGRHDDIVISLALAVECLMRHAGSDVGRRSSTPRVIPKFSRVIDPEERKGPRRNIRAI